MAQNFFTEFQENLGESINYGFIHNINYKNSTYAPKILVNDPETGQHVLTDIQNEINKSQSFAINVAFVTEAGIGMLKTQFLDFAERGGHGRLLISPYLGFNHPKALQELLKLRNVEVRMTQESINSHAKMYLFNHGLEQVAIIGSSNLTHNALKINYEWNIKLSSTTNGDFIQKSQDAFDKIWNESRLLTKELIKEYEKFFFKPMIVSTSEVNDQLKSYQQVVQPNQMQEQALKGLSLIREKGANKALIISATGTGKTYLSAFDVKTFQPNRFLFIVHREQILRKAQSDYQKVLHFSDEDSCIYRSGMDISNKKYIFATIQSLSKTENLLEIDPEFFDYILIDEVHKAGAISYQKIIEYFKPHFLLGMTATPERTDGKNIYEIFDYNIAYEIRLQEAMNEEMLCPFLYYGVSELFYNGELLDDKTSFNKLVTSERVNHIISKINYYGHSGKKVKGLIFCSKKSEAKELSLLFNQRGFKTIALTGDDSQEVREEKVKKLEAGVLDYIFTVDIFNEGVDIPAVNQVVMLRNTESSIIFIQQLGRGLRKHPSKEFVTIIDFIGNYQNNYLIPIALFGDQSMNKDNYRRELVNRNQLEGITTINFEEVAQNQIFDSITRTNLSNMNILREAYQNLFNRLGRPPLLTDFIQTGSIDPIVFFEGTRNHYGEFLVKMKENKYRAIDPYGQRVLTFLSRELLDGKRPHELLLLKHMFNKKEGITLAEYKQILDQENIYYNNDIIRSVVNILTLSFFNETSQKKYGNQIIQKDSEFFKFVPQLTEQLENPLFIELAMDAIEAGLLRSKTYIAGYQPSILEIGKKYSRKDFCRLMNWDKDESSTIYGYKPKHGTCPIFVTYHKSDDISQSTQYGDRFINEQIFHWYTRSKRNLTSKEVVEIVHHKENKMDIHLFVKKEDGEGKDFYYLGPVELIEGTAQETTMPLSGDSVVTMNFKLEQPIPYNLMEYLLNN